MKSETFLIGGMVFILVAFIVLMLFVWGEKITVNKYCIYEGYEKYQLIDGDYYCQTGNEFVPVEWME